ncbi:MAG: EAL domain-containing protein [Acidobacteriota bacterium]
MPPTNSFRRRALKATVAWLGFAVCTVAVAQDPWRLTSLRSSDGLLSNSVRALHQDRFGFVWIATDNGVQRYDGHRFLTLGESGIELKHRSTNHLFEDQSGSLWIGSLGGVDRADLSDASGVAPTSTSSVAQAIDFPVYAGDEDSGGRLWLGGEQGLFRLDENGEPLPAGSAGQLAPTSKATAVLALQADPSGPGGRAGLWIGFRGAAPRFQPSDGAESMEVEGIPTEVRDLAVDSGAVWLAAADGLYRVDTADPQLRARRQAWADIDGASSGECRAVLLDSRGRLWVGSEKGLTLRDREGRRHLFKYGSGDPSRLGPGGVTALLELDSGEVWAGTRYGGVTRIDSADGFTTIQTPATVSAIARDAGGQLWIGTDGGGLCVGVGATAASNANAELACGRALPQARQIHALLSTADATWIGAEDGLYRLDSGADDVRLFTHADDDPTSLGPGAVRALDLDPSGRLWVALWGGGLSRLDPGGENFEHFRAADEDPSSLPNDLVLTLYRDRRDHLWIGTAAGLSRRTADGRFHTYRHDPDDPTSLRGDAVRAIRQGRDGDLWVGTDAGLNRLPADRVASPPVTAPNNRGFSHVNALELRGAVNAIEEDGDGRLWLATARGPVRFDPGIGESTSGDTVSFPSSDGLQAELLRASAIGDDGRLYFGGIDRLEIVHPAQVAAALATGGPAPRRPARIAELRFADDGSWAARGQALRLPAGHRAIDVAVAALDFRAGAAPRFAYRLSPGESSWLPVGPGATFTLAGVPAGQHELQIRRVDGAASDGAESDIARLAIRVDATTWRSGWAMALYAAVLLATLAWLIASQLRRRHLRREVSAATRVHENRLQLALDGSGDGLWDWDLESGEVFRSGIAEMLGFDPAELPTDATWRHRWIHPDDRERIETAIDDHLRGKSDRFEAEYRARDGRGTWRWILDRGNVVERSDDGAPKRMAGTFKDLTRHKETERELRLWSTVFEAIDEGVMVLSRDGRVQAVNDAFCYLFGRPRHGLLGRPVERLRSTAHDVAFYRRLRREILVHGRWSGEMRQPRADGSERLVWMEMRSVTEPEKGRSGAPRRPEADGPDASTGAAAKAKRTPLSHYVVVVNDITRRKRAEEELRYLADFDPLTRLPNRSMFAREAGAALAKAQEEGRHVALIFADLDRFKQINDTLGHAAGDQLLQEAARRLLTSVRTDDLVARLGGDEMIVLLHDPSGEGSIDRDSVRRVAKRILGALTPTFTLDDHDVTVSASLGISLAPDDADTIDGLLERADAAMYEAKAEGRNRFNFYRSATAGRTADRMTLDRRLRRALDGDSLELHYQPIFDLGRGDVVAMEALLRWRQPDGELWRPERFLGVAEATGLIVQIEDWVLATACGHAADWSAACRGWGLAVNLSSQHLDHRGLVDTVATALRTSGLPAERLSLEVTEDAVVERDGARRRQVEALRDLGARLSIDDFGTGASSLAHLQHFAFDELKLDGAFVADLRRAADGGTGDAEKGDPKKSDGATIARTVLAMAEGLGVEVVAEAVETEEQLDILAGLGYHRAQGHLIGRPLPAESVETAVGADDAPWRLLTARRASTFLAGLDVRPND